MTDTTATAVTFDDLASLRRAVDYLARHVTEKRNTIPILSHVLIEPCAGGARISGTDLDMMASFTVPAAWDEPAAFCVDGALLADVLKKCHATIAGHPADTRLIHRHKEFCQLAGTWDFATVPPGGCMAEEKVDGWRALYLRDWQGKPGLFTRGGRPIEGVGHILHRLALIEQCAGARLVFDGEYQAGGCLSATKAWCERGWKAGGEAGTLHLFDAMSMADWQAGGSSTPLYQRKAALAGWIEAADRHPQAWEWRPGTRGKEPEGEAVKLVRDEWCASVADVMALARRVWMAGGEGLVIKDAESAYVRARSPAWLKVKSSAYVAR